MASPAAAPAALTITTPDGRTREVELKQDQCVLGRDESSALSFPSDKRLSRNHLIIERTGSGWAVRDLGSRNGTFVNGTRITSAQPLNAGDRISAGALLLQYTEGASRRSADNTTVFTRDKSDLKAPAVEGTLAGVLSSDPELQSNARMRALIEAGRELCGHKSLDELFDVILVLSIEAVGAERGVLITHDALAADSQGGYTVRAQIGRDFRVSSHVCDVVVHQKRSLIVKDALADESLAARASIVLAQVRGILAVPLQTDKEVIGLIYLDSPLFVRDFTRDDLNVLTVLANIAAIRIEQARLAEIEKIELLRARELEHAALIQRSILPPDGEALIHRVDFQLSASMIPAREVGGDLFDYFLLDEHHLGFVVGDVSGKGVPAALFMAVARTRLRATAEHVADPGDCFTSMNDSLAESNAAGMYVTMFYGVLDTRTGELTYANAGHNHPLIFSPKGVRRLSTRSGPMLGLFEGKKYQTLKDRLEPGEGLVVYTDGVTEALDPDDQFFGDDRLHRVATEHSARNADEIARQLHAEVNAFAGGAPQADDITVLVLRRPAAL